MKQGAGKADLDRLPLADISILRIPVLDFNYLKVFYGQSEV